MEKLVIGAVLADDEIAVSVVGSVLVDVVDLCARRQRFPERPLRDQDVFEYGSPARLVHDIAIGPHGT
jgi:hypothetical protein